MTKSVRVPPKIKFGMVQRIVLECAIILIRVDRVKIKIKRFLL